jgi:hypothetical protein
VSGFFRLVIAARIDGLSHILGIDVCVWIVEVWVVEDIGELCCERRSHPLCDRKGLSQAEVVDIQTWPHQAVGSSISESPYIRRLRV